jgi:excisionase family DNA binding protein
MPPKDEPLLTLEEVVVYLRVHPRTVYRLVHSGEIPAVRVGRQWRIRRSALDAWLERRVDDKGQVDAAVEPAPTPAQDRGPRRVLIVDDDEAVRRLLARVLGPPTHQTDAVSDGQTAIDHLRVERYDVLIVDLQMPGVSGMDVIRVAKGLTPDMPVIIITGHSSEASAIDALNLGVKAYLTKPFRARQVLTTVEEVLGD